LSPFVCFVRRHPPHPSPTTVRRAVVPFSLASVLRTCLPTDTTDPRCHLHPPPTLMLTLLGRCLFRSW
ncbi:hypothetical protein E2562_037165, partial [Oryza meyeriana var. granulata]